MKFITTLFYALCGAVIGYLIGDVVATLWVDGLKRTNETVMARDVLEARALPWLFAGLAFIGVYKLVQD